MERNANHSDSCQFIKLYWYWGHMSPTSRCQTTHNWDRLLKWITNVKQPWSGLWSTRTCLENLSVTKVGRHVYLARPMTMPAPFLGTMSRHSYDLPRAPISGSNFVIMPLFAVWRVYATQQKVAIAKTPRNRRPQTSNYGFDTLYTRNVECIIYLYIYIHNSIYIYIYVCIL